MIRDTIKKSLPYSFAQYIYRHLTKKEKMYPKILIMVFFLTGLGLAVETAATQTKPACAGFHTLSFWLLRDQADFVSFACAISFSTRLKIWIDKNTNLLFKYLLLLLVLFLLTLIIFLALLLRFVFLEQLRHSRLNFQMSGDAFVGITVVPIALN
jgi:cell division protein FtsW (lipid II flippase)